MLLGLTTTQSIGFGLALISCVLFGVADFAAAHYGEKISPQLFIAAIYLIEMPALFVLFLLHTESASASTNGWLFFCGCFGTLSYIALVYGLSHGRISIVTALSGLLALVVPSVFSVIIGEPSSLILWIGVLIVAFAIVCVTQVNEPEKHEDHQEHTRVIKYSVIAGTIAGLGFGVYLLGLAHIESPIISHLLVLQSPGFIYALYIFGRDPKGLSVVKKYFFIFAGLALAYNVSQVFVPLAEQRSSLIVTNIIVNLYPGVTLAMAFFIKNEKISRTQIVGYLTAVAGIVFVCLG